MYPVIVPAAGIAGRAFVACVQTTFEVVFSGGMPAHVLNIIGATIGDLFLTVDCTGTLGGSGRTGLNAIRLTVFLSTSVVDTAANTRA